MEKIKKKPTLAIVCPFINLPHYIVAMIDSIRTKESYIVILIDNNSNPETRKDLAFLKERDDIICVEHDQNTGVAISWNEGMKIAFEEYGVENVLIANNDILYHPDCIDAMIRVMHNDKYALVSAMDIARECATPQDCFKFVNTIKPYEVDEPEFSCFMVKKETWDTIGTFDGKFYPAYFEDNDYHYRIRLAGKRGVRTTTALYYHYGSRTVKECSDVGSVVNAMYLQNEAYFVEKWGGKPGEEKYNKPFNDGR